MSIKQILTGHLNELLGRGTELSVARLEVCKKCPLYKIHPEFGPMCNKALYLEPVTDEVSETPKKGFKRGCGCRLNAKTRNGDAECPAGKW